MSKVRVFLEAPSGRRELSVGSYVLGRSGDCDIVLESGRASRRHARIIVTESGANIEDLGSANGTYVNGGRIPEHSTPLGPNDFIVIGELGLEIEIVEEHQSPSAPTPKTPIPRAKFESRPPPTARSTVHEVLTSAADFALRSGQFEMAERTLASWLSSVLEEAQSGMPLVDEDREGAERYAVELAVAMTAPRWVDYVIELAAAMRQPIADDRARLLTGVIDKIGVVSRALESYIEMLQGLPERVRGRSLERAMTWRAKGLRSR